MLRRIFSILFMTFILLGLLGASGLVYLINYYKNDLPDYKQLEEYNPPATTRVYSVDGRVIAEFSNENRIFVPFEMMPKTLIHAFIAAEDQNFYSHPGIDLTSVLRAIVQNVLNIGTRKSLVGGSTITQQVVKNFLLTSERSLARKIKEAILAYRISQVYSKDRIIELYLNQIYLGNGAYGVAAAALSYFNKSLDQLTPAECAFLAGLPKAPSTYHPKSNYSRAKARRDYVIDRMYEDGYLTEAAAKIALNSKIVTANKSDIKLFRTDYFTEELRRQLFEIYGEKTVMEGGLSVYTTVIPEMQVEAEKALKTALINYDQKRGYRGAVTKIDLSTWKVAKEKIKKPAGSGNWQLAVVQSVETTKVNLITNAMTKTSVPITDLVWLKREVTNLKEHFKTGDVVLVEKTPEKYLIRQIPEISGGMIALNPDNGKILAMVGGYDFAISQFNRATQAKRQPGSTFKPFVYLAALENGILPTKIFEDGPIEISQGPGLPMWKPKNFGNNFMGPITMREALEKSRNTVTPRIAQMIGMAKVAEIATRFGIYNNPPKNFATVLGASETTLLQMTLAFGMIENLGTKINPNVIDYIQDINGKTIYKNPDIECRGCMPGNVTNDNIDKEPTIEYTTPKVTDERSAYQILSILNGVIQRGTGQQAKSLGMTLFGKTGTTNDSKDVWFIGGNTDLVVGTYIGYDQPRTLGQRVTGATLALPAFIDFMKRTKDWYNDHDFTEPEGISFINIDYKTGKSTQEEADGKRIIKEAFKAGNEPEETYDESLPTSDNSANNLEDFDDDGVY